MTSHDTAYASDMTSEMTSQMISSNTTLEPPENQTSAIVFFVIRLFVAVIGVIANSILIFCVCFFPKLKKTSNVFIANLSIVDLLTLIMDICVFIPKLLIYKFPYQSCCMVVNIGNTLTAIGILNLVVISIDRFIFIQHPFKYHFVKRTQKYCICLCWVIPGLVYSVLNSTMACQGCHSRNYTIEEQIYNIMNFTYFGVCYLLIAAVYSVIFYTARKQGNAMQISTETQHQGLSKTEVRIIVGYLLIVGIAFASYMPSCFLALSFLPSEYEPPVLFNPCVHLLLTINSACNPFIYGATQSVYREAFLQVFKCNFSTTTRSELNKNFEKSCDV